MGVERQRTGLKLGSGSEPALELPWWKRGKSCISCFWFTYTRGRRVWALAFAAVVEELSQEEEAKLGPQALVVVGPAIFFVDIWGLAVKEWESLVPAYTSSSIFCEKLISGDAAERDNVSGEMGSESCVSSGCDMLSWLPWLFY